MEQEYIKKTHWFIGGVIGAVIYFFASTYLWLFYPPLLFVIAYIDKFPLQIAGDLWVWFFHTFLSWMQDDPYKYFDTAQYIHHWFNRGAVIATGFILGVVVVMIYKTLFSKNRY
jgi:hypothetical protein